MNKIFDSHAHYNFEKFDDDRDFIINKIKTNGVCGVMNVGCDIKTSKSSINLSKKYDFFYSSVGIHPHEASNVDGDYIDVLKDLANHEKVFAVGEMGLDYYYEHSPKQVQKRVFINQLKLAKVLNLPAIIHSRDAIDDTLEILNEHPDVKGVVHCFSYDLESAKKFTKLGYYIGITGMITFSSAKALKEAVKNISIEHLVLETDCPYMAPNPYRGSRSDSSMILEIAKEISRLKGICLEDVLSKTTKNSYTLFNI